MTPPHRAAGADYYEEFGVEPSASPMEVRDAFRALVRILHPDHLTDPDLKGIAERQLRRMNAIYEVLSDPARRRAYDASLLNRAYPEPYAPSAVNRPRPRFVSRVLWIGVVAMLAGTSVWLYLDSPDRAVTLTPERVAAATRQPDDQAIAASLQLMRNDLRDALAERDEAKREAARLQLLLNQRGDRDANPATAMEGLPATRASAGFDPVPLAMPTARTLNAKPLGSDPHQFAGFWFYAQGAGRADKSLYLPQFVEAVMTERNGIIHGRYRSRYQIPDRAIPADVNFEFTGIATTDTLTTPWLGPGGAKGKVSVRLTGENTMKFEWTASDAGYGQGLTSGAATLTRRIE